MAREVVTTSTGQDVTVLTGAEAHAHVEALGARPGEFTTVLVAELLALNTPEKPEDTPFSSFDYTSRRRIYGR